MHVTTMTSREFNQDASKAKRIAAEGPVFITDRGKLAHVLLSIAEYQKITQKDETITDLLAMPDAADIEFEISPLKDKLFNPADLS